MTDILLTNDDGYKSAGFLPLLKELSKEFSVVAVAPDKGRSWIGKAITTKKELKLKKIKREGFDFFLLNGTPADCVQVGLYHVVENRPKLVASGINIGLNIGHARILSSGTIGAAMEASIDGVKAIASSLAIPLRIKDDTDFYHPKSYVLFENAVKITVKVMKKVMGKTFNDVDLFSINIPFDATADSDVEITEPFKAPYGQLFHRNGNRLIQRTPPIEFKNMGDSTDLKALSEGKISVTPISLTLFSNSSLKNVERIIKNDW